MEKIRQLYQKACVWLDDYFVYFLLAVLLICGIVCAWLLYAECRTDNEYNDVNESVQSIESDNQQARQQIGNASAEIEHAQKQLSVSIKRTDRITERTQQTKKRIDGNAEIVRECQTLIDAGRRDAEEARGIFADIDKRNKINGTQTDSNA